MRKTLVSAAIGVAAAVIVMGAINAYLDVRTVSRFAALQQQAPSEWLLIEGFSAPPVSYPEEPALRFVGTPSRDLYIRLAVSSREADTGNVLCSGGGATVLYQAGIPIPVNARISRLAGLEACEWEPGRYRVRLTFLMTEPDSQVSKTLLIESDDIEVIAP